MEYLQKKKEAVCPFAIRIAITIPDHSVDVKQMEKNLTSTPFGTTLTVDFIQLLHAL